MEEIIFKYAALISLGLFVGFLLGISISKGSVKAKKHEICLDGCRYTELERKCKYYEDRDKKITEAFKDLEEDYNIVSKKNIGLHQRIEKLEKSIEKLKVENKALFEKVMFSESKNMGDEDYIKYLEALLDKSNITYIDRQSSQSLLGDQSNE